MIRAKILIITLFYFGSVLVHAAVQTSEIFDMRVWPEETGFPAEPVKYPVDVDLDGLDDIFFYGDVATAASSSYEFLYLDTAEGVSVSCINIPVPGPSPIPGFTTFAEGYTFGSELEGFQRVWASGTILFHGRNIAGGIPSTDGYMGIRIVKNSGVHYGWIRLIFPGNYDFFEKTGYVKIKQSGFQTVPDKTISAGEGKAEETTAYQARIVDQTNSEITVSVDQVSKMILTQQTTHSLDLAWEDLNHTRADGDSLTYSIPFEASREFHRWRISENLEYLEYIRD